MCDKNKCKTCGTCKYYEVHSKGLMMVGKCTCPNNGIGSITSPNTKAISCRKYEFNPTKVEIKLEISIGGELDTAMTCSSFENAIEQLKLIGKNRDAFREDTFGSMTNHMNKAMKLPNVVAGLFSSSSQAEKVWKMTKDYKTMQKMNPDNNPSYAHGWFLEWLFSPLDSMIIDLAEKVEDEHD